MLRLPLALSLFALVLWERICAAPEMREEEEREPLERPFPFFGE